MTAGKADPVVLGVDSKDVFGSHPIEVKSTTIGPAPTDRLADQHVETAGDRESSHRGRRKPTFRQQEGRDEHGPEGDRPEAPGQCAQKTKGWLDAGEIEALMEAHQAVVELTGIA